MKIFDGKLPVTGFEHLHQHCCEGSFLDGASSTYEYALRAKDINQSYICITDHGMMSAIPSQIRACDAMNVKPLFGCELYLNNTTVPAKEIKLLPKEERIEASICYHLLAIAFNNIGYKNLVHLSSWAWLNGFYKKPRINYEQLIKHREGIIFTSCCYNSEIGRAFDKSEELAEEMVKKYMEMFPGNFYLEIMLLDFQKQKPYDAFIVRMHYKYHLPIICTQDVHFCNPDDSQLQRYMLMMRNKSTIKSVQAKVDEGEDVFELQDKNLWMKSEEELNIKYSEAEENPYYEIIPPEIFSLAKQTTVEICKKAQGVELDRTIKLPEIPNADDELFDKIKFGLKKRGLSNNIKYKLRLKEEYELIIRKGFSSYFLIKKRLLDEARRKYGEIMGGKWAEDYAVAWGRGSGVGSLVCYCLEITNVDPIRHDLLFSRFLNESRGGRQIKTKFVNNPIN